MEKSIHALGLNKLERVIESYVRCIIISLLTLPHLGESRFPMGIVLDIVTIFIVLRCCHDNLCMSVTRNKKVKNLNISQDIGLVLLRYGTGGIFGF